MPNHVTNVLSINNTSSERVQEILEAIKYDDKGIGSVDFEKIIPIPDNIYRGNLGADEFKQYGEDNWYDYCTREWHTKWNSYWHDDNIEYEEGSSTIRFLTAWSAPDTIIKRLSEMFSDAEFEHKWADEDFGSNCGYCIWQNGEVLETYLPADSSKEAYEFAAEILEEKLSFDKISGYGYVKAHLPEVQFILPYSSYVKQQLLDGALCEKTNDKKYNNTIKAILEKII